MTSSPVQPEPDAAAAGPDLVAAAARAFATLHAALGDALWSEEAALIAHARILALVGRMDLADAALAGGAPAAAIARVHLHHARGDHDGAVGAALAAAARFPEQAAGFRNSAASMLSALGRDDEALALIEENTRIEPHVELWHELRDMLAARRDAEGG